jgi:hypothetical protein
MISALSENNYLVIDNFISEDRANKLYEQFKESSERDDVEFKKDTQCPLSLSRYNYKQFVELLVEKIPELSNLVDEPLLPTYSYARVYKNGDRLYPHKDREACEISVTLHLGGDGTKWPLYFTRPDKRVASVDLKPGQAVVYLGIISTHWREKFNGQDYGQVFLHYVMSNGSNWNQVFDKARKE